MPLRSWHHWSLVAFSLCLLIGLTQVCLGQANDDPSSDEGTVEAPPNTRQMATTLGGSYYVDSELLNRFENLKARLTQIREEIASGNITSDAAKASLSEIQEVSSRLREELERAKTFVSPFQVYSKTSEQVFPLGDERLVIITGDDVTVRGWEGTGVKCVVEKVIVAKEQPADEAFAAIAVKHELTVPEDKVGLTRHQRDQQEEEYLNSETGRALTQEQRANRQSVVNEIHWSFDDFAAFQGREANSIELAGLTHQEGNRNLLFRINSPGGGESLSSQWQRHAKLTVYLPPCKYLAVRGCTVGVDIQDIECNLVLTTHGSKNRDYEGSFKVRGVKGDVTINQAPVHELSEVTGDVTFMATNEFVNSGVNHSVGGRAAYIYETKPTRIDQIAGDLHAEFLRTDLTLSAIGGVLDIVNRFGATSLTMDDVKFGETHRILSESGEITVSGPSAVLERLPIYAYTQAGRLHTNIAKDILKDVNISGGRPQMAWRGFVTPPETPLAFGQHKRPAAVLANLDRSDGLDLISRAGVISILKEEDSSQ